MKSLAQRLASTIPVAMIVLAIGGGTPHAQTSGQPAPRASATTDDTAGQFKEGAQRIGEGAERIGEGIKQGAIQTWEAVKAGATAAADKIQGGGSRPKTTTMPPPPPSPPPRPGDTPR